MKKVLARVSVLFLLPWVAGVATPVTVQAQSSSYVVWSHNNEIWRMREDGPGKTQLTASGPISRHPTICSKARRIAFDQRPDIPGAPSAIWLMDKNGGSQQQLTGSADDDRPDCGLDGVHYTGGNEVLAFHRLPEGNIYTMPLTRGYALARSEYARRRR